MRLSDIFQITTHLFKTTLHDSKGRGLSTELNHKNSTQPLKLKQIVLNFETEMFQTPSSALKERKKNNNFGALLCLLLGLNWLKTTWQQIFFFQWCVWQKACKIFNSLKIGDSMRMTIILWHGCFLITDNRETTQREEQLPSKHSENAAWLSGKN